MRWPTAYKNPLVYVVLLGCGAAICGWQVQEHARFKRNADQALINRGRDITSTLGVIIRAQSRRGMMIPKDRLESAMQDLVRPNELASIAILGATGEIIASAGEHVDVTGDMLRARGVYWREHSVTIMNLMDLGSNAGFPEERTQAILVLENDPSRRLPRRDPRQPDNRTPDTRPPEARPPEARPPEARQPEARQPDDHGADSRQEGRPPSDQGSGQQPGVPPGRSPFGRPPWMTPTEYEEIIQKRGVHSIVLSLSTDDMHRAVRSDLLLRSLVSIFAAGGAIISSLAWRNLSKNAELQIRLVKAGEMNTHLKEMNLAAAGLAHETRNPLNLIRGLAQMIAKETPESKTKEHAATILEEADRVTVQLNEFINYSKPREPHLAPVEITRLIADVTRTLVPDIEEKQIQVTQPTTPLTIEADEPLLRQALFNVIMNATQAVSQGGRIEVRVSIENPREAMLEIADDGPGVPASERTAIFKPYVTMRPKGVGLGLAIVQQITSAHHWSVSCEPNTPRGACFRFRHLRIAAAAS